MRDDALVQGVRHVREFRGDAKEGTSNHTRRVHRALEFLQGDVDVARGLRSIDVFPQLAFAVLEICRYKIFFAVEVE